MTYPTTTILPAPTPVGAPDADMVTMLLNAVGAERRHVPAGEMLQSPDEPITTIYAFEEGHVRVCDQHHLVIAEFRSGALIGALEMWTGRNWNLMVETVTPCTLVALPAEHFRTLVRVNSALRHAASYAVTQLMRQIDLAALLTQLLDQLPARLWAAISATAQWRVLHSGERLLAQGEITQSLFLVVRGRLQRLYRRTAEPPAVGNGLLDRPDAHVAGHVEPGETLGSFLEAAPHPATVIAVRETTIVELPPSLCQMFWDEFPHLALPFLRHPTEQQRTILATLDARPEPPATLALIPVSAAVDMVAFLSSLATAMEPYGHVQTITRATVDHHFGQQRTADIPAHHPLQPLLMDWLDQGERACDYLLYVADASWTEWTRRCLRQADRILLIVDAATTSNPTVVEQAIYALALERSLELVLLHSPAVEQPSGTIRWLEQRSIHRHYHVRRNDHAHFERLARCLTGHANALVLAGGGAKGFAHVGVFQALEERAIPIDMIGGTSMGALMGLAPALGWSMQKTMAAVTKFGSPKALFDYTLPVVSLFTADKVTEMIQLQVGDTQIEDLWRPYFALSTDLTAACAIVHRQGSLWRAVRASLSIPAIFPPVIDEQGHVLVDGGLMNNFPVDIMRQEVGSGKIIGVKVGSNDAPNQEYGYEVSLSGWQVLRSRLDPRAEQLAVPSLASILVRSAMVNNIHLVEKVTDACDLLIEPDVQHAGLLDFAAYPALIEHGYRAAVAALQEQ